ncbi:MAG: DUF1294 domain-containing protein [Candidatus Magasanikbacteria bacterium CG_4_10_14_0_2_um_filter_37_12]|uniref:DUF1294 domain-containing protein n=1 Tax=Candidatus Magasanikbacteria bacterium CG_4_10_14_0_2_um_filter_37_12 TaxID=1974637 RepID=A0A2M7V755_9BACT|nr:MAG: DUF1294 domain-containing protein [Candidatus Magasanikbacteria bacterium CG_4_10_14_0_2_um_filter_37_12]
MFSWFSNIDLYLQITFVYLIIINATTFFYFGIDKIKSQFGKRRINEKMLWTLTLVCGSVGALLGMSFFRHKTKKVSFQAGIAVILALQIVVLIFFFN